MGSGLRVRYPGLKGVRAKLQDLADRLREAAGGVVVARAAEAIKAQVEAVGKRITGAHELSGDAHGTLTATSSGGRIRLAANRYLKFHGWWVFRKGMPAFVLTRALKIFSGELQAVISGQRSPLMLAEEAAEVKAAETFKREIARLYRRSDEYKAKRREERAHERRTRAREERE